MQDIDKKAMKFRDNVVKFIAMLEGLMVDESLEEFLNMPEYAAARKKGDLFGVWLVLENKMRLSPQDRIAQTANEASALSHVSQGGSTFNDYYSRLGLH